MSAREAVASCRTALLMISSVADTAPPEVIKGLIGQALGALDEVAKADEQRREKEATRKRDERKAVRERPRTSADVTATTADNPDVRTGGKGGDLSVSPRGSEDQRDPEPPQGVQGGPRTSADVEGRVDDSPDDTGVRRRDVPALQLASPETGTPAKRKTRCPSSVDPRAADFCRAHGIPPPVQGTDAQRFLDHWAAEGKTTLDWAAKWRARPEWTKNGGVRLRQIVRPEQSEAEKSMEERRVKARARQVG